MSQDLFAAFGAPQKEENAATKSHGGASLLEGISESNQTQNEDGFNDDDWGEFEGTTNNTESVPSNAQLQQSSRYLYNLDDLGASKDAEQKTKDTNLGIDLLSINSNHVPVAAKSPSRMKVKNLDVLFDAEEEDEEDQDGDFGDFEDYIEDVAIQESIPQPVQKLAHQSTQQSAFQSVDLLGLDDPEPVLQPKVTPKQAPSSNLLDLLDTTPTPAPDPVEEKWEDFPEDEAETSFKAQAPKPIKKVKSLRLGQFKGTVDSTKLEHPPTTIPPPATVLSIFSSVFEMVNKEFLQPWAGLSQDDRKHMGSDLTNYLQGYISVLIVCGHVIAGRKLRWKRDTILSQSMRIGQASSGKLSGMKVATLDKTEANKDDREVAEVLQLWAQQSGKIKSAIAEAKKFGSEQVITLPDLRETMPVRSVTELEGGVGSVKSCSLCGLKRQERVGKVDADVQDSFGEWWDEKVIMHRACRNFWMAYEGSLRQR